jgi:hypothetical protein
MVWRDHFQQMAGDTAYGAGSTNSTTSTTN